MERPGFNPRARVGRDVTQGFSADDFGALLSGENCAMWRKRLIDNEIGGFPGGNDLKSTPFCLTSREFFASQKAGEFV